MKNPDSSSPEQFSPLPLEGGAPSETVPVVQEDVSISRVVEETGGAVRVRVTSREEKQQIPLVESFDEVFVERVPVNRYVNERTDPRQEGEVVIIPIFESVAVVEQRLLLKEEVRIIRQRREVQLETELALRKEAAIVERRRPGQEEWSEIPPDQ